MLVEADRVVYDPVAAKVHKFDPLATIVFEVLDGDASIREVARDLAAALDADVQVAERDLVAFAEQLCVEGLLEPEDLDA